MTSNRTLRNRIALLTAAIATGTMAWTLPAFADEPTNANPAQHQTGNLSGTNGTLTDAGNKSSIPGMQGVAASDVAGVRDLLTSITDTAVSPDATRNIAQYFSDESRNRLTGPPSEVAPGKQFINTRPGNSSATVKSTIAEADLNAKIDQLRKDWEAKYKQPFDIKDKEVVFNNDAFQIIPGDIGDQARTAGEKIPPHQSTGDAASNAVKGGTNGANPTADNPARSATLHVTAANKLPALDVHLSRGLTAADWKIETPSSLTQQQLHDNLLTQITALDDAKDKWPTDVNDAYREISHRVLLAVTNHGHETPMEKP